MQPSLNRTQPKRLLHPASGYLTGYTHTLNPYTGCAFACSYCYVRQMPVSLFRGQEWGTWVDIKQEAPALLHKEIGAAKRKGPVRIFMSSSTDPYQPVEYKEKITRALLETMVETQPDFLFLQTRSPLVTRDLDLLEKLGDRVLVSMTVETDREDVRRAFAPASPPIAARLQALEQLVSRRIPAQAAIAPLLPSTDRFAAVLAGIVDRVCMDDTFRGDGSKGRRTEKIGIRSIYEQLHLEEWYTPEALEQLQEQVERHFPIDRIRISQQGFLPV
jgi:DNA repair photolyase